MNLAANDFTLFNIPESYAIDLSQLQTEWKRALATTHPDRFAQASAAQQRLAMQQSVRLNEAYQRLKNPLKRAEYLCMLRGSPVNAEHNTAMPPEFLMQQIELHEALADARTVADLAVLETTLETLKAQAYQCCATALDTDHNPLQAAQHVRCLMFLDKLHQDLKKHTHVLLG